MPPREGAGDDLAPGLYEALVTEGLRDRIERARAEGWLFEREAIDDAALAEILARHIHDRARDRFGGFPTSATDRRGAQIDLANRVLEVLAPYSLRVGPGRGCRDPAFRCGTAFCLSTGIEICR